MPMRVEHELARYYGYDQRGCSPLVLRHEQAPSLNIERIVHHRRHLPLLLTSCLPSLVRDPLEQALKVRPFILAISTDCELQLVAL